MYLGQPHCTHFFYHCPCDMICVCNCNKSLNHAREYFLFLDYVFLSWVNKNFLNNTNLTKWSITGNFHIEKLCWESWSPKVNFWDIRIIDEESNSTVQDLPLFYSFHYLVSFMKNRPLFARDWTFNLHHTSNPWWPLPSKF